MHWMFDDIYPARVFHHPEPGNVDLLRTMPLPDSAANAETPMPKNIADHEGPSLRANSLQNLFCQISGTTRAC